MSSFTVQVNDIAPTTSKETLHDFFTFCGKINSIDLKDGEKSKSATVDFEKASAAKTALMLNGGTLDGAHISVTSETVHPDSDPQGSHHDGDHIDQSDKPRAGIAAEYLARGYTLSDAILQRAIEIDQKQGISTRFLNYIKQLDSGVGSRALGPDQTLSGKVTTTLKSVDEQRGITKIATDYYSKAISSPLGQRVFAFYSTTSKQVIDIHEEARRIADQHKSTQTAPTSTTEELPVPSGSDKEKLA